MLDTLIVFINAFLILIIYLVTTKFWDYRIKRKLIKEGFIDDQNLGKIFSWNKKKELLNLLKVAIFCASLGVGLFIAFITGMPERDTLQLIALIFGSLSVGGFISFFVISKVHAKL